MLYVLCVVLGVVGNTTLSVTDGGSGCGDCSADVGSSSGSICVPHILFVFTCVLTACS